MHLSIFISVINQFDAQNIYFTVSLFHASSYFEHMCSKYVEAWNKLIVKQKFCASSWLLTEINIQNSSPLWGCSCIFCLRSWRFFTLLLAKVQAGLGGMSERISSSFTCFFFRQVAHYHRRLNLQPKLRINLWSSACIFLHAGYIYIYIYI